MSFLKDFGTIVVIISILIFYARIMWLRQQMKRKSEMIITEKKIEPLKNVSKKAGAKKKQSPAVSESFLQPKYQITNWLLGGPGIVLMLVGVVIKTSDWFPMLVNPYWYIPTALGVLLLTFSINSK
jgi:hypothetical protein